MVLGGQIIGNKNESCYLNSWKHSFESIKDKIKNEFECLKNGEFDNRTDEELFELIWKANQLEEDFDPNFDYLPVLDNKVWYNCKISIDETTDSYLIAMLEKAGAIKFLWKGLRNPCPTYNINKLFDITVERNFIIQTMEECLEAIIHDYPGLP